MYWKAIIAFITPRYKADDTLKNYQTISKIKGKLDELEKEKGTTWAVFMAEELLKARADLRTRVESEDNLDNIDAIAAENELDNLDNDGDPSLYGPTMAAYITVVCVVKSSVAS